MIYEFAVDPESIDNWRTFIYVIEKFGVSKGRLISRFPKRWEKVVLDSYNENSVLNKSRIVEILSKIKESYYISGRQYDNYKNWIDNAIEQHNVKNFRAILTNKINENISDILSIDELEESNFKFAVNTGLTIKRKAKELGEAVSELIKISKEIIFVDPHFDPNSSGNRFINTLVEWLKYINIHENVRIEYHLKQDCDKDYFTNNCNSKLRNQIPLGLKIKFIRWQERGVTETLHPRYILTERGGINIEKGLDEGQGDDTTDVKLLDNNLYLDRWKDYCDYKKENSTFKFIDEVIVVGNK